MSSPNEGLPNEALLDKKQWHAHLDQQVAAAEQMGLPLSVVFIDVNHFKDINDELGHDIGDEVIKDIQKVVSQFTDSFSIGGHIGGDEFALSGYISLEEVEASRDQLKQAFSDHLDKPENEQLKALGVGLAVGVASRQPGEESSQLTKRADDNMYEDKIAQLPELTDDQLAALSEARLALAAVGLRLRDIQKFEKILGRETES